MPAFEDSRNGLQVATALPDQENLATNLVWQWITIPEEGSYELAGHGLCYYNGFWDNPWWETDAAQAWLYLGERSAKDRVAFPTSDKAWVRACIQRRFGAGQKVFVGMGSHGSTCVYLVDSLSLRKISD